MNKYCYNKAITTELIEALYPVFEEVNNKVEYKQEGIYLEQIRKIIIAIKDAIKGGHYGYDNSYHDVVECWYDKLKYLYTRHYGGNHVNFEDIIMENLSRGSQFTRGGRYIT